MTKQDLKRDECMGCHGYILTGDEIVVCKNCNTIVHEKCSQSILEYDHITNSWECWNCVSNCPPRYNPFNNDMMDKHDPNCLEIIEDLQDLSKLLDNCNYYNVRKLDVISKDMRKEKSGIFSCLCNNIDGNAANFDTFVAEVIDPCSITFSVIGVIETNINACHKDLYCIRNYTSEYNDKCGEKLKGSGIGLYVHNDYVFYQNKKFCRCTRNIECLFITVTNADNTFIVGLVYRPPSGCIKDFYEEMEVILEQLPKNNLIIMGDFNSNLLQPNVEFENAFYSNNIIPIISIPTHEKPGCKPSLIDNIFISSSETLRNYGVLENKVSHHCPVFCLMDSGMPSSNPAEEEIRCPKYDYCESNISNLIKNVVDTITTQSYHYDEDNFISFVQSVRKLIDNNLI